MILVLEKLTRQQILNMHSLISFTHTRSKTGKLLLSKVSWTMNGSFGERVISDSLQYDDGQRIGRVLFLILCCFLTAGKAPLRKG